MNPTERLRTNLREYLNRDSAERAELRATLEGIASRFEETVIFGGMLREFALGNARGFSSDIDLVTFADRAAIYSAIKSRSPIRNRFGGYRFVAARRTFDIWAFDDTWAFREGLVIGSGFRDLLKTTFFNLDAAAFHLKKKEFLYSEDYSVKVKRRVLDLNLQQNPFPDRMARRAIGMAIQKDLSIGPDLASFILLHIKRRDVDWIGSLFWDGLRHHVDQSPGEAYTFRPQELTFT